MTRACPYYAPSSHEAPSLEETPPHNPRPRHGCAPARPRRAPGSVARDGEAPQPYYVSVACLRLPPEIELNDTAIMLTALSGWIKVGGNPPHSVAITSEGLAQLKERGLAS